MAVKNSARTLSPEDVLRLSYVHDACMAPQGDRIAYVVSRTAGVEADETFGITIEDLHTAQRHVVAFGGRAKAPRWSASGDSLCFVGESGDDSQVYVVNALPGSQVGEPEALTSAGVRVVGRVSWSADGRSIAFTAASRPDPGAARRLTKREFKSDGLGMVDQLSLTLHIVDCATRIARQVDVGELAASQPAFSPCGKFLLFMGSDAAAGYPGLSPGATRLCTVRLDDGDVHTVLGPRWFIVSFAWSPCGEKLVVAGDFDSSLTLPTPGIWVVNRDGSQPRSRTKGTIGNVGSRVHHDMPTWETSQNNVLVVPNADHALATVLVRGRTEVWRIELDGEIQCHPVVSGERTCIVLDARADGKLAFCASDFNRPWELLTLDAQTGDERQITHLNEAVLTQWPALRIEHLDFHSDDGMPLEGWFLALEGTKKPQPTVLFIHGGPMLATGPVFRFDFHLLAANGIAVLTSNFRGSSGYGEPFNRAIIGDWGARGYPDHMAAVDAAISRGLADPARLGVWGPSHGGFATTWIIGHTHRFRAALAESAAVNFVSLYYLSDAPDLFARDLGGRPDEIPDVYRSRSPLSYVHRARTPTLIVHGEDDARCPIAEAEQLYRALHDAGCQTEFVRIRGMSHMGDSVGPIPARLAQNEALIEWFERLL